MIASSSFVLLSLRSLFLFKSQFLLRGYVEQAELKRSLIWTQSTVRWCDLLDEILVEMVDLEREKRVVVVVLRPTWHRISLPDLGYNFCFDIRRGQPCIPMPEERVQRLS